MLGIYLLVTLFSQFSFTQLSAPHFAPKHVVQSVLGIDSLGVDLLHVTAQPTSTGALDTGALSKKLELEITFPRMEGLAAGSPVTMHGRPLGTVVSVKAPEKGPNGEQASGAYLVAIEVTEAGLELPRGTVALQTAVLLPNRGKPSATVELLTPPASKGRKLELASRGDRLKGYNSCEEFWSSAQASAWN